jgi:hypothetical protein
MHPSSTDNEFMGMMDYVVESFHDLLTGDSEMISNSDSSGRSHHPSRECFMADTLEGHVESVHDGRVTPLAGSNDEVEGDPRALPCLQVEQLRA